MIFPPRPPSLWEFLNLGPQEERSLVRRPGKIVNVLEFAVRTDVDLYPEILFKTWVQTEDD